MCTNKTCFAGSNGAAIHIFNQEFDFFRIHANDVFSKISVSTSDFDSQCEPGVFAEPGFEWNLIFVLLENSPIV